MEDSAKRQHSETEWEDRAPAATTRWLVILCVVMFAAAVFSGGYAYEQNATVSQLKQQNQTMNSAEAQLQGRVDTLDEKIGQMTPPPPAAPVNQAAGTAKSAARPTAPATQDRRFKQMQAQLAETQKDLKRTQDDLAGARSDLEGQLGSTRDELNGSIAKTHDELEALEKRGERRYYEFDLSKSKSFQKEGPIQISLRKADAKHQSYDVMMMVNDHQLSKKKVDLYEPIWLHEGDLSQPVQVVVNKIDKNRVHGYVSMARYKESEQASNATHESAADSISHTSSTQSPTSPTNNSSTPSSNSATMPQGE